MRMAVTVEEAPWLGWMVAKALMRFAFMVANNLVAIPSYICYIIILQPLRVLDSKRFWYIEGLMYKWLLGMVASWGWYAGYTGKSESYPQPSAECSPICTQGCDREPYTQVLTLRNSG